jgi:hypothetical protein
LQERRNYEEASSRFLIYQEALPCLFPGRFVAEAAKSRMVEGGARSEEHIMDEPDPNPTLTAVAEWVSAKSTGSQRDHFVAFNSKQLELIASVTTLSGGNLRGRSISG